MLSICATAVSTIGHVSAIIILFLGSLAVLALDTFVRCLARVAAKATCARIEQDSIEVCILRVCSSCVDLTPARTHACPSFEDVCVGSMCGDHV